MESFLYLIILAKLEIMADVIKNLFKVILGIVLIILAIWFAFYRQDWGQATLALIKGGVVLLVILIGLVLLLVGFSDMRGE